MEQFTLLEGDHTLKESRELINNALLTVRSLSAGTAFPTDNLSAGMLCYRTDLKRLYRLADETAQVWSDKLPADLEGTADTAASVPWSSITDKPTAYPAADHSHPYAGASQAGGAARSADKLTTARTINQVAFDGTQNITIDVGIRTVNGQTPDTAGNLDIAGLPIGHEYFTLNPNIPAGSLPLTGGTYSRSTYAALWAWVQTQGAYLLTEAEWQAKAAANDGSVPYYSDGDGSTTFRVPSLACWIKGANGISEVGSYLAAGLPNITGTNMGRLPDDEVPASGAVYASATSSYTGASSDKGSFRSFDASRSNPIYGASDTVQPPSVVGMWLVKAFGTVSNVGNQDIADISAGLTTVEARMADIERSLTDAADRPHITDSYRDDASWYRVWSDGFIEQGGTFTPSGTGYQSVTITLLKPFTSTAYTINTTATNTGNLGNGIDLVSGKTTTSFTTHTHYKGDTLPMWHACGY